MVVGLGAFPARAPHTRPVKLAATAPPSSSELVSLVGVVQGEYEVPAGAVSALEMGFDEAGVSAVTLWARVPHYVSGMPFPEAGAALIDGLVKLTGVAFDSMGLYGAGDTTRHEIDQLVARSVDHQAMVRELEESVDEAEGNALGLEEVSVGGRDRGRARAVPARRTLLIRAPGRRQPRVRSGTCRGGGAARSSSSATTACGRPRPRTTRSCRSSRRPAQPSGSSWARASPWPLPAIR